MQVRTFPQEDAKEKVDKVKPIVSSPRSNRGTAE
jgi:hypothetical protein